MVSTFFFLYSSSIDASLALTASAFALAAAVCSKAVTLLETVCTLLQLSVFMVMLAGFVLLVVGLNCVNLIVMRTLFYCTVSKQAKHLQIKAHTL